MASVNLPEIRVDASVPVVVIPEGELQGKRPSGSPPVSGLAGNRRKAVDSSGSGVVAGGGSGSGGVEDSSLIDVVGWDVAGVAVGGGLVVGDFLVSTESQVRLGFWGRGRYLDGFTIPVEFLGGLGWDWRLCGVGLGAAGGDLMWLRGVASYWGRGRSVKKKYANDYIVQEMIDGNSDSKGVGTMSSAPAMG